MTKFTFYPASMKGLKVIVSVRAACFTDAKERVLKWIYQNTTAKHQTKELRAFEGVYAETAHWPQ